MPIFWCFMLEQAIFGILYGQNALLGEQYLCYFAELEAEILTK